MSAQEHENVQVAAEASYTMEAMRSVQRIPLGSHRAGCVCMVQVLEPRLASDRVPDAPRISVSTSMEESQRWGCVDVQIPYAAANPMLGRVLNGEAFIAVPDMAGPY